MSSTRNASGPSSGENTQVLPATPQVLAKVIRYAADPDQSLRELGKACAEDPGLTVELLRIANSARYSSGDPVRSVSQAVVKLGARIIRAHAMTYIIRAVVSDQDTGGLDTQIFWEDSLRRAVAAQLLADEIDYDDPSEAYTLGLTQDLGTLLLAIRYPKAGAGLQRLRQLPCQQRPEFERKLVDTTVADEFAASELAHLLPKELVGAVGLRHEPVWDKKRTSRLSTLAWAADGLVDVVSAQAKEESLEIARERLTKLGCDRDVEELIDQLKEEVKGWASEMNLAIGEQPSLQQVMVDAQNAITEFALEQESHTSKLERLLSEQTESNRRLQESNRRLMFLARKDPLTGLDNRRSMRDFLQDFMSNMLRTDRPFTLLVLDIDHFKKVNDTYGHAAGDQVLKAVARQMTATVRTVDVAVRLGGEEFCVLLAGAGKTGGRAVAERIRTAIAETVVQTSGQRIAVTVSVGGATTDVENPPSDGDELLDQADRALYLAKRQGRNRVCWSDSQVY